MDFEKLQKDFYKGLGDANVAIDQSFKLAAQSTSSGVAALRSIYRDALKGASDATDVCKVDYCNSSIAMESIDAMCSRRRIWTLGSSNTKRRRPWS